jgi:hypothetical protein
MPRPPQPPLCDHPVTFGEEQNLWSFSLCNFLYCPVKIFFSAPDFQRASIYFPFLIYKVNENRAPWGDVTWSFHGLDCPVVLSEFLWRTCTEEWASIDMDIETQYDRAIRYWQMLFTLNVSRHNVMTKSNNAKCAILVVTLLIYQRLSRRTEPESHMNWACHHINIIKQASVTACA